MRIDEMINFEPKQKSSSDLRMKVFEEIKSDEKFYSALLEMGLSDELILENLGQINDIFEQEKNCKNCKDVKLCPLENAHLKKYFRIENGLLSYEFGYCYKYNEVLTFQNNILINDLTPEFEGTTYKNVQSDAIRKPVINYFSSIYKNSSADNNLMFIYGTPKSGSTFLTNYFFSVYVKKHECKGIYADASKRIDELNELLFKDKVSFNEKMELYKNVDILVINKISSAYINDFIRDNIIHPIISARYKNNKVTIITSEIKLEDFITVISGKTDLGKIKGKQIYDLLKEFEQFNISQKIKLFR